jgi:hypothetical protein
MASIADGNTTFRDGQNDREDRSEILSSQYRRGINVTTKDGRLGPRPGFSLRSFRLITEGAIGARTFQEIIQNGKFQGAISYDAEDGQYILAAISGLIFRFDPRSLTVENIPIGEAASDDRMDQYRRRIPVSHAGRFVVFFDYPNLNVIVENKTARRVNKDRESSPGVPLPEIPASVLGAYVNNRLHVANELNDWISGDPVGPDFPDAPITFEEVLGIAAPYPAQAFSLGSQSKNQPITFMGFLQVADSASGVGPLIIGSKNSIYAARVDEPRINWENVLPFDRVVLFNAGPGGPRCVVNVNSDIFVICGDAQIRSLMLGRQEQEKWSNAPMSKEVHPWIFEYDKRELREIAFAAAFGNRIFFSVAPYQTSAVDLDGNSVPDYAHGGMVVLETDNLAGLGQSGNPAWAGMWNGISPMEIVVLEDGPYIFAKDDANVNAIYFLDEDLSYDEFDGEPVNIISRIYTRSYDGRNPLQDKELTQVSYDLAGVEGELSFLAEYRPGNIRDFALWRRFEHNAVMELEEAGREIPIFAPHDFRDLDFGDPEEVSCDALTDDSSMLVRKVEFRLTISARNWSLGGLKVLFDDLPENGRSNALNCDKLTEKRVVAEYEPSDWELYRTGPRSP